MRPWLFLAGLNGLIAVVAGAFGRHWLKAASSELRDIFNIGVEYQMWHALALLAVAWLAQRRPREATVAGSAFTLGIVLFSGTLYAMGMMGEPPLRGLAPIGGTLLIVGWACFMWAATRKD